MADLERRSVALGQSPALLLVDLIKGFTDPSNPLGSDTTDVVNINAQLLTAFRTRALPVVFTTVAYENEGQARVFRARLPALETLRAGTAAVEVDDRLTPRADEPVIVKHYASAFFDTPLARMLRKSGVDSLVIAGLTTSGCVRASVIDGLQHEYPVWVPKEGVGDRNHAAHEANLHDMHAKYAEVVSVSDVLGAINGP